MPAGTMLYYILSGLPAYYLALMRARVVISRMFLQIICAHPIWIPIRLSAYLHSFSFQNVNFLSKMFCHLHEESLLRLGCYRCL